MMVEDAAGVSGPSDVSALVVGMEHYEAAGLDAAGAALLAARFAKWLIDRHVCAPERIALMTGYQEPENAPHEQTSKLLTHLTGKKEDGGLGVELLRDASADGGFADWVSRFPPLPEDKLFVLFWVGHGFALAAGKQVCLLGADATGETPKHQELDQFLRKVASYAPDATQVAFIDVCRDVVTGSLEWAASETRRTIRSGDLAPSDTREQYIMYSATHGLSTREAGWQDERFASALVDQLDQVPAGQTLQDFFADTNLTDFLGRLAEKCQGFPFISYYGYYHPGKQDTILSGGEGSLTIGEWKGLLTEATRIDGDPSAAPSARVLNSAYCHALGRDLRFVPPGIVRVVDLVQALVSLHPEHEGWPPLIVACDYVANLPDVGRYPRLGRWCDEWAADSPRRRELLDRVRKRRPFHLPEPYLSIEVNDTPYQTPRGRNPRSAPRGHRSAKRDSKRYTVRAILWDVDAIRRFPSHAQPGEWGIVVAKEEILQAAERLLGEAGSAMSDRYSATDIADLVVEFVLPECLLGLWPEYGENRNLGDQYPIVIRDLRRLNDPKFGDRKLQAHKTGGRIEDFARQRRSARWSDKVDWIICGSQWPTPQQIQKRVVNQKTFCIGLAPPMAEMSRRNGDGRIAPGLVDALDAGAAIIVVILHWHEGNERHWRIWNTCKAWRARKMIAKGIDQQRRGLLDLPYLLRDIRRNMTGKEWGTESPRIGVVMEEEHRLWPGMYLWRVEEAGQ